MDAKKKVTVKIAGVPLTLVTDEPQDFVDAVSEAVNERVVEVTRNSYRINRADAALLCAVDFCGDKLKAEKKVRNLETQLSLYNVNMRRLREEIVALKRKTGEPFDDTDLEFLKELDAEAKAAAEAGENPPEWEQDTEIADSVKQLKEMLRASGEIQADDRVRTLEKYLDSQKKGDEAGQSRAEKIKYIESLLRQ